MKQHLIGKKLLLRSGLCSKMEGPGGHLGARQIVVGMQVCPLMTKWHSGAFMIVCRS